MSEHINLHDSLSRAYWLGCFSCTDRELVDAVRVTGSTDAASVGLFLATPFASHRQLKRNARVETGVLEGVIGNW